MKIIKQHISDALPFIAVAGVTGIAVFAASKVYSKVKNITITLDVMDDFVLKSFFQKENMDDDTSND